EPPVIRRQPPLPERPSSRPCAGTHLSFRRRSKRRGVSGRAREDGADGRGPVRPDDAVNPM
ncbi:MAG: hypothetical protein AVDCRST_MAG39-2085, partial [uncultured Sphingomonadaceae bacterium]